jgi:hypothetical protein
MALPEKYLKTPIIHKMLVEKEATIVAEYKQLRDKLNAGLAKQVDVDRTADIQDMLEQVFMYDWDELFDAQFGIVAKR